MKNLKYMAVILFAAIGITSCLKDSKSPKITVETPAEHSTFKWGEMIHLDAEFKDNRGLKSYMVMIGDSNGEFDMTFNWVVSGSIEGKDHHLHEHFTVPDSAMMARWVHFSVTDEEDNTATAKWMLHFEE
ncbi:MAG: DUF4625 domain-containing protein [Crocinitomicaceae bacterium]|nr:DUF4625 domain-containing protein [Crocinitomicaceae bacterium]